MEQFSTVRLQIWSVLIITWYLHLKNWNIAYGTHLGTFGVLTFFEAPNVRGLITVDPDVFYICNFAGAFCIMMFKMWHCANFQFLSVEGPVEMGQLWFPKSAVVRKWSNFQPFRFKLGLCTWFQGISTWKTGKTNLGPICAPFEGLTLFGAQKLCGTITMETSLCFIWNLAGFSYAMISKSW